MTFFTKYSQSGTYYGYRLMKLYNSCNWETVTLYNVPNVWMHCREKAVSIKLSILWLGKKGIKLPVRIIVPFSPDRCGWKGCFMFSVQFLITKNGGVHFIKGVMSMSTQVPNRGNEFRAHVLSPQQ